MKKIISKLKILVLVILFSVSTTTVFAAYILIPMDRTQSNHLKAYGIAYWILQRDIEISWLLNYRGGSYLIPWHEAFEKECKLRNVSYQVIADAQANAILYEIGDMGSNMDEMKLQKVPRIAVYSPKNKLPWDDAVTLVLAYAEIPYDIIYDDEVLEGVLPPIRLVAPSSRRLFRPVWKILGTLPPLSLVSG
jgi:general stress protein CsbA